MTDETRNACASDPWGRGRSVHRFFPHASDVVGVEARPFAESPFLELKVYPEAEDTPLQRMSILVREDQRARVVEDLKALVSLWGDKCPR